MHSTDAKKCLFVVLNRHELMIAIHIKKEVLQHQQADIILVSDKLTDVYDNHQLAVLFDKVYYVPDVRGPKVRYRLYYFVRPGKGLTYYVKNMDPLDYSDIYYWNPIWITYYLYKISLFTRNEYKWHFFTDGDSAYVDEEGYPTENRVYALHSVWNILNIIDRHVFRYPEISKQKKDIYLWQAKYRVGTPLENPQNLPQYKMNDYDYIHYLNKTFNYEYAPIKEKVIFIDAVNPYNKYSNEKLWDVIQKIIDCVGYENFVIKKHRRDSIDKYEALGQPVKIMDDNIPWELFCLNGGAEGKTIIGYYSSALFMPYIMSSIQAKTLCIHQLILEPERLGERDYWNYVHFARKVANDNKMIIEIENDEQLREELA